MSSIAIIERDQQMRQLLVEWLEAAGYEVRASSSAGGFDERAPDLVIADLYMPRQGGRERVAELRARWPGAPVIAISCQFRDIGPSRSSVAQELGATRLIAKPLVRETLLSAVLEEMP